VLYSSLALQWLNDLDAALAEFARVMRPNGLLVFSTFGPDTLKELRAVFATVDGYTHVNRFLDLHDIGDALVRHGFREVVMDVEHFTVTYDTVRDLMRDLKVIGAHNATQGRARGLMGRQRFQAIEREYEKLRADGKLPLSYEVVYGTAWAPDQSHLPPGAALASKGVISVDALRAGLRTHPKGGDK
jgi:malonyl-CoA O-methyltransferase